MKTIKCKYCGKSYTSPSEMRKRKCHSHPKGAWGGYCTPDHVEASFWGMEKHYEEMSEASRIIEDRRKVEEQEDGRWREEYKKHTPLLDCVLNKGSHDEPNTYELQIRNLDLNGFAVELANGLNKNSRDAINTVYALRAGCDYVLSNAEAQKEGSLNTWLDAIQRLKNEVVSWDFWVALYWLTKPIKDAKSNDDKNYERSFIDGDYEAKMHYGKRVSYWIQNSIARVFHVEQVIPLLHAVNKKGDEKEIEVMHKVTSYVHELRSQEKGFERIFETLYKRINDYSFWGVLYCLYWMKLHPTPWDDQKVWPILVSL